ncbi:MAG: NmrA family NAD(P)-binding protein [Deltaproteobacteria bacterium]|nr:NmrA family NAD(P)-binding protein [Deltaproteobacteria bacterium]
MADYVIAGVSGNTGKATAQALLDGGASVRVVVRDAAKGEAWRARGAEVAVADLGDAGALASALRGARGCYLLVPPNMAAPSFVEYQKRTGQAVVEAVRQAKVPHVVFLSSVGAELSEGTGPIKGLKPVEEGLRALDGTVSTFLRAAYFMENLGGSLGMLAQGVLPGFQPTDLAFPMIATRDIGAVAARELREGARVNSIIELSAAKSYSLDDAAAALTRLTGREVKAQAFPLEAMVPTLTGFGFPQEIAALYQEMTAGFIAGRVRFHGTHRTVHGPTELSTVLQALLANAPKG